MRKPSLLVIFLTVFIDLIGFGIVLPLLPQYSERFGARGWEIGFIIASFSVMQLFFAPVWGRWSDRIGRRPVLLISNAGSVVSYGMFAWASQGTGAQGLWLLLASRLFAGVCGANISVASAYIADITPPERRSKGMGLIGMSFGLGFILGPAISAVSAHHWGPAGPGWVATGLCGFNFLLACGILGESRGPGAVAAPTRPRVSQWLHTARQPRLGLLIGLYFLSTFCFACFESVLPLLVGSAALHRDDLREPGALLGRLRDGQDLVALRLRAQVTPEFVPVVSAFDGRVTPGLRGRLLDELNALLRIPHLFDERTLRSVSLREETQRQLGSGRRAGEVVHRNRLILQDAFPAEIRRMRHYFDPSRIGYLFAYCGILSALVQGGAMGRLAKRFGESWLIAGSLGVVAVSSLMIVYWPSLAGLLCGIGLFATASGVTRAPTMTLISVYSPPGEQGATMGVAQSAATLARIVGPPLATTWFYYAEGLPFVVCALVAAGAGWIGWQWLVVKGTPGPGWAGAGGH